MNRPSCLKQIGTENLLTYAWYCYLFFLVGCGAEPRSVFVLSSLAMVIIISLSLIYEGKAEKIIATIASDKIFYSILVFQAVAWIVWTETEYRSFRINNFDTGIFSNLTYTFFTSGYYYSSILGIHGFADHFTPNVAVLSFLYYFFKTPLLLDFLKILSYVSCALILKRSARRILGEDSPFTNIIPILFLLNRYVFIYMTMQFQPSSLALPFFLGALCYASQKKYFTMFIMLFITSGFKEHLGLGWIAAGFIAAFYNEDKKIGCATALAGVLVSIVTYFLIMPAFADWHPIHHTDRVGIYALWREKITLVPQILGSVGFLPLFTPFSLFAIVPCFAISFLSGDANMTTLDFHYHDLGICAALFFSIHGLKQVIKKKILSDHGQFTRKNIAVAVVVVVILNYSGRQPMRYVWQDLHTSTDQETSAEITRVQELLSRRRVPSVVTQDFIGPYFFNASDLKTINKEGVDPDLPDGSIVIASNAVNPWPLSQSQLAKLISKLDDSSDYVQIAGFKNLHVWRRRGQ